MKTKFNLKKAFTLLELSIVIALVAIVGTVTTSLCILVSKTATKNANQLAFMQDVSSLQYELQKYVSGDVSCKEIYNHRNHGEKVENHLVTEYEHIFPENKAVFDTTTKTLSINYTTITFETIDNISFIVYFNGTKDTTNYNTEFIIICTVTANGNYANDGTNSFVFTINPFVLETVNITNGGNN